MRSVTRRQMLKMLCAASLCVGFPQIAFSQETPDIDRLKTLWERRLKRILSTGELPYIDIESSCNPGHVDIDSIARAIDRLNIGLMALSADIGKNQFAEGVRYQDLSARLTAIHPDLFIPVGNGGQPPALTEAPEEFIAAQEHAAAKKKILLFGEYEFRHYPSPRQAKRNEDRDVNVPINGPTGARIFEASERTGLPFQIHYEIEDELLGPFETMLEKHPKAKVIWCHLAQVRYSDRATRYSPAYVESLIKRFPNLFFDLAFGDAQSVYPPSGERHSRIWATFGGIKDEWRDLIATHPGRFLSALDLGGDRLDQIGDYDRKHRQLLKSLPERIRHEVAYRSAWRLLFNEEFPG